MSLRGKMQINMVGEVLMSKLLYREISLPEAADGCLLCSDAPCRKACPYGVETDIILRSLRFENAAGAANRIPDELPCLACSGKECRNACLKGLISRPVPVDEVMEMAASLAKTGMKEVDLSVDFCGVRCENPFFLSSSVVGSNYEMVSKAFDFGWGGVFLKTIGAFVPEEVSPRFDALSKGSTSFTGVKSIEQISDYTLEENINCLKRLKADYPGKVVVASIMGRNEDEWNYLAKAVSDAGADLVECSFACPDLTAAGVQAEVSENPELVASYIKAAKKGTSRPIIAKIVSNAGNAEKSAAAAIEAGAIGISAKNNIKSIMNINADTFVSGPDVEGKTSIGRYTGKAVKPMALGFVHSMKSSKTLSGVPLSGMGGIETWKDAFEFLALGCENVQVTTAVMQYGYRIIEDLTEGMKLYLSAAGYGSITGIIGRALPMIVPAEELERETICLPRFSKNKCIGCGRCYISCYDGGHQAIKQNKDTGRPVLDPEKCTGCHLCIMVCPAQAISPGTRIAKRTEAKALEEDL